MIEEHIQIIAMEAAKNILKYCTEPIQDLNPHMALLYIALVRANDKIGYQLPIKNLERDILHPAVQTTVDAFFNLSLERQTAVLFRIAGIDLLQHAARNEGEIRKEGDS